MIIIKSTCVINVAMNMTLKMKLNNIIKCMHLVKHRPKIRGRFVIKSVATIQQEKLNI